jgi:hypothetical protein
MNCVTERAPRIHLHILFKSVRRYPVLATLPVFLFTLVEVSINVGYQLIHFVIRTTTKIASLLYSPR